MITTEIPADAGVTVRTLADVLDRMKAVELSPTRRRDLLSAVTRLGALLDTPLERLPADPACLRKRLDPRLAARLGLGSKTFSNLKSNVFAAIEIALPPPTPRAAAGELSPEWQDLLESQPKKIQIGLSAFVRYCSAKGVPPIAVTAGTLAGFAAARDRSSLGPLPTGKNAPERLWNEVARRGHNLGLQEVPTSPKRERVTRISWDSLPDSFQRDVEAHLAWASGQDLFASDARSRPLAPKTIKLRRNYIHSAAAAYVAGGGALEDLVDLAALVRPDAFRTILLNRHAAACKRENAYTRGIARELIALAREWADTSPADLEQLKDMRSRLPCVPQGLTDKNKALLRALSDPGTIERLLALPDQLFARILRDRPCQRRVDRAQAAVAIAILIYCPLRIANLSDLRFDETIFLPRDDRAESIVEIAAADMKTREPFSSVLPPDVTRLLRLYRDDILVPMLTGAPKYLFDSGEGTAKLPTTVSALVRREIERSLGVDMTAHQFRHLAAKLLLDAQPGAYEVVRQLLGHRNLKTTVNFYAGIDTRRASRFHANLVQQRLRKPR